MSFRHAARIYRSAKSFVAILSHFSAMDGARASPARRLEHALWNDPGSGVMRHADAGYQIAIDCAKEQGLKLPGITA